MVKKQTPKNAVPLEKIIALSGITLVLLGCIANVYSAHVNARFIHDPIFDIIYYFRYIILLLGGFGIGFFMTKKASGVTKYTPIFNGVFYAAFATLLYELLDGMRLLLQGPLDTLPFPWGKVTFLALPLVATLVTLLVAYTAHRTTRSILSNLTKKLIITAFAIDQLYLFTVSLSSYEADAPLWPSIVSYLLAPITVAGITYLLLPRIKNTTDRALYAVLVATFYSILGLVIWEFRTDASMEATNTFAIVASLITVILTTVLIWQARRASLR